MVRSTEGEGDRVGRLDKNAACRPDRPHPQRKGASTSPARTRERSPQNHDALSTTFLNAFPAANRRQFSHDDLDTAGRSDTAHAQPCAASAARSAWSIADAPPAAARSRNTSSAAPAISFAFSASTRSSSFVVIPRPILMKNADRFIFWNRARLKNPSVAGVCGTVRITKSARGSSSSSASGLCSSATPAGADVRRASVASTRHAERRQQPRRLRADPADADDQRGRLRQMHHIAGLPRRLLPLAAQLLRNVHVQPAREGQHESHDMRADMIVEDFPEIGDLHRVRDQFGIVITRRRRDLRRLQPAQFRRPCQQVRPSAGRTRHRHRRSPAPPSRRPPPARRAPRALRRPAGRPSRA